MNLTCFSSILNIFIGTLHFGWDKADLWSISLLNILCFYRWFQIRSHLSILKRIKASIIIHHCKKYKVWENSDISVIEFSIFELKNEKVEKPQLDFKQSFKNEELINKHNERQFYRIIKDFFTSIIFNFFSFIIAYQQSFDENCITAQRLALRAERKSILGHDNEDGWLDGSISMKCYHQNHMNHDLRENLRKKEYKNISDLIESKLLFPVSWVRP